MLRTRKSGVCNTIYMSLFDKVGEILQEEGYHEQTDVHAVDIGIGGDYHLVVAEAVEAVFKVEGGLEEVELVVAVKYFLCEGVAVLRLASKRENGLGLYVSYLCD